MKVTPLNVGRFWVRLMFPRYAQYHANRLTLRGDLPWEPWLHCGVWLSMFIVLVGGDRGILPPVDGIDILWLAFGLISPPIGFASVWMLAFRSGRVRYVAMWLRMIADAGVVTSLGIYQFDRWCKDSDFGTAHGVVANVVLDLSIWFMAVLVYRDAKLISATERLAAELYRDARGLTVDGLLAQLEGRGKGVDFR